MMLCFNYITGKDGRNNLATEAEFKPVNISSEDQPDIFFVVLDEYTSSECLKENFNYNNKDIDSTLKANNFFLPAKSQSNYNVTPASLASTMYLSYLQPGIEEGKFSSRNVLQAAATLKSNPFIKFLEGQGYEIKNYGSFDFDQATTHSQPFLKYNFYSEIDDQTFWSRVRRDIGWNFALKNIRTGSFQIPEDYKENKASHINRNKANWKGLVRELNNTSDKPRFVYSHLILPHEPFFLDSNGKEVSDTAVLLQKQNSKEAYVDQVKYCNKLLKEIMPLVSKKSIRKKIVVIEGDHGFRFDNENEDRINGFKNFNAYYFSDGNYQLLYDGISPVNTFRVVMKQYFSQPFELLQDSTVYLLHSEFKEK